jgi:ABC transport permease subunit
VLRALEHVVSFVRLIGDLTLNLGRLARAPHEGPGATCPATCTASARPAMPITALVGFLIGVVLAYLTSQQLQQFGADAYIVNILGIALIRELGPMLAAILIAGRSGSAITAQIGVMRVTEELDAMRVMGISRGYRLVMPRAMALAVAMPLISVWTTICALAGGMLAADVALGITPTFFLNALPQAVSPGNLGLASSKSVVFGVLIALIGCHFGLRVQPNTQSLGEGTTASVVTSITVVILVEPVRRAVQGRWDCDGAGNRARPGARCRAARWPESAACGPCSTTPEPALRRALENLDLTVTATARCRPWSGGLGHRQDGAAAPGEGAGKADQGRDQAMLGQPVSSSDAKGAASRIGMLFQHGALFSPPSACWRTSPFRCASQDAHRHPDPRGGRW